MNYYKERLELVEQICQLKSKEYAKAGHPDSKKAYDDIAKLCGVCSIEILEQICGVWSE